MSTARITITLEDTGNGPPFPLKVRRLLKVAFRMFGLRCVDMKQETK